LLIQQKRVKNIIYQNQLKYFETNYYLFKKSQTYMRYYTGKDGVPYRGSNAIILLYDITNSNSFNNVKQWLGEIDRYACEDVIRIIVGNKTDLESQRTVEKKTAIKFAEMCNVPLIETSCKLKENIDETINLCVSLILFPIGRFKEYINPYYFFSTNWNEKTHLKYPESFQKSIFSFIVCLKVIGFTKSKKFPKFILFEIIKKVFLSFDYYNFIKELSQSEENMDKSSPSPSPSPSPTPLKLTIPNKKKVVPKKNCLIN
jgi:hypothetical protein